MQDQNLPISAPLPAGSIDIVTSYLGFRPSLVTVDDRGSKSTFPLSASESKIETAVPTTKPYLDRGKTYLTLSRKMFWIGLGGAILSQVAESQNFVPARTTGNAFWGLGWTMWLGFLGLTEAEYDDAVQEYNSHRVSDLRGDAGDPQSPRELGRVGSESSGGGIAFGWRILEF